METGSVGPGGTSRYYSSISLDDSEKAHLELRPIYRGTWWTTRKDSTGTSLIKWSMGNMKAFCSLVQRSLWHRKKINGGGLSPSAQHWWDHISNTVYSFALPRTRETWAYQRVQWRASTMIMGLEYLSHKEKLRVSTVQSGYQKDQRDLIHVVKILMGWCKDRTRPFQ